MLRPFDAPGSPRLVARVLLGSRSAVRVLRIQQEHLLDRDKMGTHGV